MRPPADTVDQERVRAELLRAIGFPQGGSTADTWGLFRDGQVLYGVAQLLASRAPFPPTIVVGIEAAGFALGGAVAATLGIGFVPIRRGREARLPGEVLEIEAGANYKGRTHLLRVQADACGKGDRALLVDDWAETGSQLLAARALLLRAGADAVACCAIVDELPKPVRQKLEPYTYVITASELDEAQR